jgi:hypothetical protein
MRRCSEASGVNTFCGFGGDFVSFAPAAPANINPSEEAAKPSRLRREGSNFRIELWRHISHMRIPFRC